MQKAYLHDDPCDDTMSGTEGKPFTSQPCDRYTEWLELVRVRGTMCSGDASAATSGDFYRLDV